MPLTVQNFGFFTSEALQKVKNDLELKCELRELVYIQSYYINRARRDPFLDELRFLDAIITYRKSDTARFVLERLSTDSKAVGESFSDAVQKLNELGHTSPYGFDRIANAADEYLDRAGKRTATPGIFGKCGDQAALEFYFKGCTPVAMPETDCSRCVIGKPSKPPRKILPVSANDVFVIIHALDGNESESIGERIEALVYHPSICGHVRKIRPADGGAIFDYMTSASAGFYADALPLPPADNESTPFDRLFARRKNCVVTAVGAHMLSHVESIAQTLGLCVVAFGHPLKAKRVSVRYGGLLPVDFDSEFISGLPLRLPVSADIFRAEDDGSLHSSGLSCAEGIVFASSSCRGGSVRQVSDSIVAAVSPLVAEGVHFNDISVSFDCKLPLMSADSTAQSAATSLLLGRYRAQAELCLRSEGNRYVCTSDNISISTFARAAQPKKETDASVGRVGSLYLVAVSRREDGLLDFDSLRKLYGYVLSLIENGRAVSVTALGCSGLDAELDALGILPPDSTNVPLELKLSAVGAFIIESETKIPGLLLERKDFLI